MGLVKKIAAKKYFSGNRDRESVEAIDTIFKIRKRFKKIDYKDLINQGRKY